VASIASYKRNSFCPWLCGLFQHNRLKTDLGLAILRQFGGDSVLVFLNRTTDTTSQ
jgi:hypothetical protein